MNVGEIKAAIRARGFETDNATAQLEAIKAIDRRIQGARRWPWNEDRQVETLGSGASIIAYPAGAREVDAVQIETVFEQPILEFMPFEQLRALLHADRETGTPRYWTERGRELYFWPAADEDYTVTFDVVREATPLVDDSDTPSTPVEYHDLYVAGAVMLLAERERDWTMYGVAQAEFQELWRMMAAAVGVRQRQSTRHVTRSSFWRSIRSYG